MYFLRDDDDMLWLLIFCEVKSWPRLGVNHDSRQVQLIQELVCLAASLFRGSTPFTEVSDLGVSLAQERFSEPAHLRLICRVRC